MNFCSMNHDMNHIVERVKVGLVRYHSHLMTNSKVEFLQNLKVEEALDYYLKQAHLFRWQVVEKLSCKREKKHILAYFRGRGNLIS